MKKIVTPVVMAGILATSSGCSVNPTQEVKAQVGTQVVQVLESPTPTPLSTEFLSFDLQNGWYENIWGQQNFSEIWTGTYKIVFPAGSYVPSAKDAPLGGAWFIAPLETFWHTPSDSKTLEYNVTFGENFDFVKGWKLPWLCGGSCPRGGSEKEDGFSTRFMWRKAGALEIYAYLPTGTDTKFGESFVVPNFKFVPGKTYKIAQKIVMNTIWQSNGSFEVFIDGVSVLKKEWVVFRFTDSVTNQKLLFATFFGGNDTSFAAKKDENIIFWGFKISE